MLSGEVKTRLNDVLLQLVETHCAAREMVTDEMVDDIMRVRLLHHKGLEINDINISITAANSSVVRRRKMGNRMRKKNLIYRFKKTTMAKKPKNEDESNITNQEITPWKVSSKGNIDYNKLTDQFGCERIDTSLICRVQNLTNCPPHIFLCRNIFFAHRDLDLILDAYERGEKFFLYTGRGPSSEALHLGHLVPFMFAKYLQDAFKVPIVIQLTDDEKFMWKDLEIEKTNHLARENAKDIIACGFDISSTFIIQNFNSLGGSFYKNTVKVSKCVTRKKAASIFGFTGKDHIGKISFPPIQAAPAFPSSFPHLFSKEENLAA